MAVHDVTAKHETANERFKSRSRSWFWMSVGGAAAIHFMVFAFWPSMTAADYSLTIEELGVIPLPPEIEIPPAPEPIARPAAPVISDAEISDDITIPPTDVSEDLRKQLTAPPVSSDEVPDRPRFTPMTVRPELRNQAEVERALQRNYPPTLRDVGIGGRATVWFFIDETARVTKTMINESSGHEQLDRAAMNVAAEMSFTPAYNRDQPVSVWISIPIEFASR